MTHGADGDPNRPDASGDGDLSGRYRRLGDKLKQRSDREAAEDVRERKSLSDASGLSRALRLGSEFIGGVVAGGLIGWAFDAFLGTRPWGLIVFLLLGFAAGVLNVMRSAGLAPGPGDK